MELNQTGRVLLTLVTRHCGAQVPLLDALVDASTLSSHQRRRFISVVLHYTRKTLLLRALSVLPVSCRIKRFFSFSFESRVLFLVVVVLLIACDRLICFLRLVYHLPHCPILSSPTDKLTFLPILPFSLVALLGLWIFPTVHDPG